MYPYGRLIHIVLISYYNISTGNVDDGSFFDQLDIMMLLYFVIIFLIVTMFSFVNKNIIMSITFINSDNIC